MKKEFPSEKEIFLLMSQESISREGAIQLLTDFNSKQMNAEKTNYGTTGDCVIRWDDDDLGFGEINVKYNGKGGYIIDAEYISLNTVARAIIAANKNIKKLKNI